MLTDGLTQEERVRLCNGESDMTDFDVSLLESPRPYVPSSSCVIVPLYSLMHAINLALFILAPTRQMKGSCSPIVPY